MALRKIAQTYSPERGDVVWLDFDPRLGHEQKGRRPALVISPTSYNRQTQLACVCPITSVIKDYPFEFPIALTHITGAVLVDQVKSHDWSKRRATFIEKAPARVVAEIAEIVSDFILDVGR